MVAAILVFGIAFAVGYNSTPDKDVPVVRVERPDKWQPKDHEEMLRACGIVCGDRNVKEYNAIHGKCTCKETK